MRQSPALRLPCVRPAANHSFPKNRTRTQHGIFTVPICEQAAIPGGVAEAEGCGLHDLPSPERPELEGVEGGGANAVGAPVHAEKEPVGLSARDEVAPAVRTETVVGIMFFNVPADLGKARHDLSARAEKEVLGNHGTSLVTVPRGPGFRGRNFQCANRGVPGEPSGWPAK